MKCLFGGPESKLTLLVMVIFLKKMTDWSHREGETPAMPGIRGCSLWFVAVIVVFHVLLGISGLLPWLGRAENVVDNMTTLSFLVCP